MDNSDLNQQETQPQPAEETPQQTQAQTTDYRRGDVVIFRFEVDGEVNLLAGIVSGPGERENTVAVRQGSRVFNVPGPAIVHTTTVAKPPRSAEVDIAPLTEALEDLTDVVLTMRNSTSDSFGFSLSTSQRKVPVSPEMAAEVVQASVAQVKLNVINELIKIINDL